MRSDVEIRNRIQTLVTEELEVRVGLASKRLPQLCRHNHRQTLDVRKRVEDEVNELYNRITHGHLPVIQTIGLCMLGSENPDEWQGTICEDPIDAQRCPFFDPKMDKSYIWEEYISQLKDPDWLKIHMPEVYGLMWSLNDLTCIQLPWWKRWLFNFLRIRIEPLQPTEDITKLLPPAT